MPARARVTSLRRRDVLIGAGAAAAAAACAPGEPDYGAPAPGGELSPITPNESFYITSCCLTPAVDRASWFLVFAHDGAALATVDLAGLEALGGRDKEHTLECISAGPGHQAIGNAVWTGRPLGEVLDALGITVPDGTVELKFTGADGYTTSVPVGDLDLPIWVVWGMNGEPLPDEHGTVVRLLVPGRYGMKNPKWLTVVDFVSTPHVGFWESVGWSNDASYQVNGLVASPVEREVVEAGEVEILGTAFAGRDPIARVEISTDGGQTWTDAELTYVGGPDVWTQWRHLWDARPGTWTVVVRCATQSGETTRGTEGTGSLDGYDGGMALEVEVV